MAYPPKTPTRHGRSRSETKTPLSSSFFSTNNLADASNPFIVPSRPASRAASPVKKSSTQMQATLKKQASVGLIRKGGVESRLDVVTRDYVPPPPKSEKRSRSQPSVSFALTFMPRSCLKRITTNECCGKCTCCTTLTSSPRLSLGSASVRTPFVLCCH